MIHQTIHKKQVEVYVLADGSSFPTAEAAARAALGEALGELNRPGAMDDRVELAFRNRRALGNLFHVITQMCPIPDCGGGGTGP